jgi:hypothetical protein
MSYLFSQARSAPGIYHVWARGLNGLAIFRDDDDRRKFESLINRYLSEVPHFDARGRPYANLRHQVSLYARNILTTHYHLILWQKVPGGIDQLMRRVMTSYTRYFNQKYGEAGSPFPGPYRARRVRGEKSFRWAMAYVNANHKRLRLDAPFSTHHLLAGADEAPSWLDAKNALQAFGGRAEYESYMKKYLTRAELDDDLRVDNPKF